MVSESGPVKDAIMSPAIPAIGVSFSAGIPGERNLVFQTHVPQDMPIADVNKIMDGLLSVADRVLAKYSIPALEAQIDVEERQIKRVETDLQRIDTNHETSLEAARARGQRKPPKISDQEQVQRAQTVLMIEGMRDAVDKLKAKLAELRGKLDGPD